MKAENESGAPSSCPGRLRAFFRRVKENILASRIYAFLTGYEAGNACYRQSDFEEARRIREEDTRARILRRMEGLGKRPFRRFYLAVAEAAMQTKLSVYSLFLFPVGIVSIFRYLILPLFQNDYVTSVPDGIAGAIFLFFALLFLFFAQPLATVVTRDAGLAHFLFEVLSLPRPHTPDPARRPLPAMLLLLLGAGLGAVSYHVSPLLLLCILSGAFYTLLTLASPEFSLIFLAFFFPFSTLFPHPIPLLCILLGVTTLSYFRKWLFGKRGFSFEALDLFVLLFSVFCLFSGIFALGSGTEAFFRSLASACFLLCGYFLAANLLSSSRLLLAFLHSLLSSAAILSAIGIYQAITGLARPDWLDSAAAAYIDGRITSILGNPNIFAAYLCLCLPVLLSVLPGKKKRKFWQIPAFLLLFAAMIFTWSRGAWIGTLVALFFFILLACRKRARIFFFLLALLPNLLLFAPDALACRIASIFSFLGGGVDSSVYYRFQVWRASLSLFADHLLGGIGASSENFRRVYAGYAVSGAEAALHSHNLYLQIGIEMGIFALFAFLLLLLSALRRAVSLRNLVPEDSVCIPGIGAFCSILALLVFGITDYVFYDLRVFFLFFLLLGIITANGRIARGEYGESTQEPPDRSYAAAEIPIRK